MREGFLWLIRILHGRCWFWEVYRVKLVLEAAHISFFLKFKHHFKEFDRCGGSFQIQKVSVSTPAWGRQGSRTLLHSFALLVQSGNQPHKRAQESSIAYQHVLANNCACKQRHVGAVMIWLCRPCSRRQNLLQLSTAGGRWQPFILSRGYTGSTRGKLPSCQHR